MTERRDAEQETPSSTLQTGIGSIEVGGQDSGVVSRWVALINGDSRTAELAQNIGPMMGMLAPLLGVQSTGDYDASEAVQLLDGISECWNQAKADQ